MTIVLKSLIEHVDTPFHYLVLTSCLIFLRNHHPSLSIYHDVNIENIIWQIRSPYDPYALLSVHAWKN